MTNPEMTELPTKAERAAFISLVATLPGNAWYRGSDTKDGYVDGVTNVAFQIFLACTRTPQPAAQEVVILREENARLNDCLHRTMHNLPKTREQCERSAYISIQESSGGGFGFSCWSTLPTEKVVDCLTKHGYRLTPPAQERSAIAQRIMALGWGLTGKQAEHIASLFTSPANNASKGHELSEDGIGELTELCKTIVKAYLDENGEWKGTDNMGIHSRASGSSAIQMLFPLLKQAKTEQPCTKS